MYRREIRRKIMTGNEIFSLVTEKKQEIEDLFDPTTFVLNPRIQELENEIYKLQENCPHHFIDNKCAYCGKEKN